MRSRAQIGLVLVTGAALLAGCGSGDSDPATSAASAPTTTMTAAAAESTDKVDVADFAFDPQTISVKAGTEVTWTNSEPLGASTLISVSSHSTGSYCSCTV